LANSYDVSANLSWWLVWQLFSFPASLLPSDCSLLLHKSASHILTQIPWNTTKVKRLVKNDVHPIKLNHQLLNLNGW